MASQADFCADDAYEPGAYAAAHSPTRQGVFGITRMTPTLRTVPLLVTNLSSIALMGTPAAIEMKHFPSNSASENAFDSTISERMVPTTSGLTAIRMICDALTTSMLLVVKLIPLTTNGPSVGILVSEAVMSLGATNDALIMPVERIEARNLRVMASWNT
jgi:hypothetical protein